MKTVIRIAVAASLFAATPAMAIDWKATMKDEKGEVLKLGSEDATLGVICAKALYANYPDERDVSGDEKFKRGVLAMKLMTGADVTLTSEEVTLVKKVVGRAYGPLLVVQIYQLIDPGLVSKPVRTETVPAPSQ